MREFVHVGQVVLVVCEESRLATNLLLLLGSQTALLGLDHVHPQILALILLLVNLLLDQVLVLRVVGVQHHDRLPAAAPPLGVADLEGGADDEDGEGQALGVQPGLDNLLGGAQGAAADEGQRDGHAGEPRGEDDAVPVLATPFHEAAARRLVVARDLDGPLRGVLVAVAGVVLALEGGRVALGRDDGAKRGRRGDEEGAEGDRQAAEGRVAARGDEHAAQAEGETGRAAEEAALEDLVVVGSFLFFADDLHCGWLDGWMADDGKG